MVVDATGAAVGTWTSMSIEIRILTSIEATETQLIIKAIEPALRGRAARNGNRTRTVSNPVAPPHPQDQWSLGDGVPAPLEREARGPALRRLQETAVKARPPQH